MASEKEARLLSLIESSDAGDVFSLFSDYVRPFSGLSSGHRTSRKHEQTLAVRSLAKQFLPFLNKSLSLLPKRLSVANPAQEARESAGDLFRTYELCLDCLELVSAQLSCKPHTVQLQRLRLIHCFEAWGWYSHAYSHAFRVLERLGGSGFSSKERRLLPNAEDGEAELAMVVVEVVAVIFKCVAMGHEQNAAQYRTTLELLGEVKSWFRVLDAKAYEKLHRVLVIHVGKCALSLVREAVCLDEDLVHSFCKATVEEYFKSSLSNDQIYKFIRQVLSSLFALEDKKTSTPIDIAVSMLRIAARELQAETDENWVELADLVSYCANKWRPAGSECCARVSKHLGEIAAIFLQARPDLNLIVRLYSVGLSIDICDFKIKEDEVEEMADRGIRVLLDDEERWRNLIPLRGFAGGYSCDASMWTGVSSIVGHRNSNGQRHASCKSKSKSYELRYIDALKFLCQPLADVINSAKRKILMDTGVSGACTHLFIIQEAFHQFCYGCLFLQGGTTDKESSGAGYNKMSLNVAVAAFILSMRTQLKMKISVHLVKEMIGSPRIQPRELKYLFTSLYNIGVTLYRNKQLEKASKALKLCFRASWTCVRLLCQMLVNPSNTSDDQLSEEAVVDFVSEACSRCAFYLDILQQSGRHKIKKFIVDILENWSESEDLIKRLPGPTPIVKHWVKMERKRQENQDPADSCTTLYSLLSSSRKFSKRTIGKILEQELLAHEELFPLCSNISNQMQLEIANILLKDVYVAEDMLLHRAQILIWKARMTRTSGTEHLRDCIQYLSEAIYVLGGTRHESNTRGTPSCHHQLPVAYCLRALCIQEAEPNSKEVFQDISIALNLWLKIPISGDSEGDGWRSMPPENMIPLLYNIIDLLSMKGCLELHHHLYQLIFRLFKWKNVKVEVCLGMLWECRRLKHALCPSPINDAFMLSLSEYCGEKSKFTDFWIDCLKVSKSKLIGFQQNFHFLHYDLLHFADNHESAFQSNITTDDVKDAASELISRVPPTSHSAFLAAYLYYDLCDRLISYGKFSEALSYAKEAHRIRTCTFQEQFKCSVEKQLDKHSDAGKIKETRSYGIKNIGVLKSIATDAWPCGNFIWDINGYYLSPWNVLQCYLESTLQVGIINELIGNGAEAEAFLSWGKTISCLQSLSLFVVAFSSALGNLYHKRKSLDLADKEIQSAKQILFNSSRDFSCLKCRLILQVTLDKQQGDLSLSHFDSATRDSKINGLSHARSLFGAALKKLGCSEWRDSTNGRTEADDGKGNGNHGKKCLADQLGKIEPSIKKGQTANRDSRKGRRSKSSQTYSSNDQNLVSGRGSRLTRSKHQSLKEECQSCSTNMHIGVSKKQSFGGESDCVGGGSLLETEGPSLGICTCNCGQCCLSEEGMEFGLLNNLTSLKWDLCRRKLASIVLVGLGKCFADSGKHHQAHEAILQSISVLLIMKPSSHNFASASHLIDFIGKELGRDVFAVERAEILYNMCWFSLTDYHSKGTRSVCCDLSHIPLPKLVSLLRLAFVLSRDVLVLFQMVSCLLAALYLLSASDVEFSFQCDGKKLSASHWASYFHQASVGTHISYLFFSNLSRRHKSLCLSYAEATGSTCTAAEKLDIPRLAPEHTRDLAEFAKEFFNNLPSSTIICISLLGGALSRLLQELAQIPSPVCAWLLLSRLNSKDQPVAVLLPVDSALDGYVSLDISDDDSNPSCTESTEFQDLDKPWVCPWGSTVVDDVAPAFKSILQENYISSSELPGEDTKETRYLWWMRRKKLDHQLGRFLRNLEDSWLGPWRYLLLGEWSNCKLPDSLKKKLVNDLKAKCKMDVNETLLKVILGGGMDDFKGEACIAQLCLKNGCYVGRSGYFNEEDSCTTPTSASDTCENRHGLALQLIHEAAAKLEQQEDGENREAIILVLDPEVQMLPWENIPILRRQEVYRMPSVGSISAVLRKRCPQEEPVRCCVASFPLIDPLDAFYLLNPGGDLSNTQVEFEGWFRDQNLEGKAGSVPTAQELTEALKNHDLFLYFGHGSGSQYISRHDIENLDNCAATFLMGCSSGSLLLNGCYIPQGIPLSYLLAGSPAIVANLWEVTDKDIDRFGKAMLESWLRERSKTSESCSLCNSLAEGLATMRIKGNTKKKTSRKKPAETNVNISECHHHPRRKIGSFMAVAREACNLPFLIGAAPVCYGVPTGIARKKKGLEA